MGVVVGGWGDADAGRDGGAVCGDAAVEGLFFRVDRVGRLWEGGTVGCGTSDNESG